MRGSLLTILSALLGLVSLIFGGNAELHCLQVGFSVAESVTITVDPVIVIWLDMNPVGRTILHAADALSCGDFIYANEAYRHHPYMKTVLCHETQHCIQQRALGMFMLPACLFANMEGEPLYSQAIKTADIDLFRKSIKLMWCPCAQWQNLWSFLRIEF